ncbi:hypothetical protein Peur_007356 [Populus x canadensis]
MRMEYPFFSIFKKSFQARIFVFLQMNGRISWSGLAEQSLPGMQIFKKIPVIDSLELRIWASYRGQTLARTVVDDYSQTNSSTAQGFELSREARARADLKFTCHLLLRESKFTTC